MSYIFRTLIVPDEHVAVARTIASGLGGGAGDNMWITPLSPSGQGTASHWISSGWIGPEWEQLMPLTTWELQNGVWMLVSDYPGLPQVLYAQCQQMGIQVTQQDINDLFDSADVTGQEPFVAMDRMNLKIINEP